jgi:hypothetical protein
MAERIRLVRNKDTKNFVRFETPEGGSYGVSMYVPKELPLAKLDALEIEIVTVETPDEIVLPE